MNIPIPPMVYFQNPANSNQPVHRATPICSRIVYRGLEERKVSAVLQKQRPGFLSKVRHDNKIAPASIRRYLYHHNRRGSRDKSCFSATNLSSQYLLRQYNRRRSIQNLRLQKDYRSHPSMQRKLQEHKIQFPS